MILSFRSLLCSILGAIALFGQLTAEELLANPALPDRQGNSQHRLPDPRYRRAFGLWEIDRVASMVVRATGEQLAGAVLVATDARAPFASMRGTIQGGEIIINPRAAAEVPPNSWAFVIGHEFAHAIHQFGHLHDTSPEQELRADIIGAEYAMTAGFDLAAHLAWILMRSDGGSATHGSRHGRALQLAAHFGVTQESIRLHIWRHRNICRQ